MCPSRTRVPMTLNRTPTATTPTPPTGGRAPTTTWSSRTRWRLVRRALRPARAAAAAHPVGWVRMTTPPAPARETHPAEALYPEGHNGREGRMMDRMRPAADGAGVDL